MAGVDVPLVWQAVGSLSGTGIVAAWLALKERKKVKTEEPDDSGHQTAQVMAAYFFDKTLVEKLTVSLGAVCQELATLNAHMQAAEQFRHDEKIAREAAAQALLEQRLRP